MKRALVFPGVSFSQTAVVLLAALFLYGCGTTSSAPATTRYRQGADETIYRARSISLGTMFPTGGLSQDPTVRLQGWATCEGRDCRPQRAWLSFVLRSPNGRSNVVSNRTVSIQTDTEQHRWPESRKRFGNMGEDNSGELTRIRMSIGTFRDIAESQRRRGQIGTEDFSVSYEDRAPMRALLEQIQNPGTSSAMGAGR